MMAIEKKINITEVRKRIDSQIGTCELFIPGLTEDDINLVLDSGQFNGYLQDQIYRWVIRTYLINAKIQDYISDDKFEAHILKASTDKGREQLAASIILSSVPLADRLPHLRYVSFGAEGKPKPQMSLIAH